MSFASNVKEEISRVDSRRLHCHKAELAAILDLSGSLEINSQGIACILRTNQAAFARRAYRILKEELSLSAQLFVRRGERLQRSHHNYLVQVRGGRQVEALYSLLRKGDLQNAMFPQSSLPLLGRDCCRHAYLRGAFLAGGSVNDPQGGEYHLELVVESDIHAQELLELLRGYDLHPGCIERKGSQVVYLKDRMAIADFLTIIGAMRHRLIFEDVLMQREMRNFANRGRNCELANVQRIVNAGLRQYEALLWLQQKPIWSSLSPGLQEIAAARLEAPEASLLELAEMLSLSKSAVNHRLRKLCSLAEESGWVPRI